MRFSRAWHIPLLALALCAVSASSPAAEPERVGAPFDVRISPASGGPQVEMTFSLTLSDVSSYPVTITAVAGSIEEQLWQGTLPEGVYRFKGQLKKITSGPVRLILKAKMTNLETGKNQTYYSYRRWEGTIGR